MKECAERNNHISSKLHMRYIYLLRYPVTKTFTPLHYIFRHFTFSHLNFTQLHFTTLSFGLTLFKFPTAPFHLTSLHFSSLHFTSLLDEFLHTAIPFTFFRPTIATTYSEVCSHPESPHWSTTGRCPRPYAPSTTISVQFSHPRVAVRACSAWIASTKILCAFVVARVTCPVHFMNFFSVTCFW